LSGFATIASVVSFACAAALAAAIIAAVMRRWRVVLVISRAIVVAAIIVLVSTTVAFVIVPSASHGDNPTGRAIALSLGISEVLNCGALAYLAAIPGAILLAVARRRLAG
jgi:hypothetical protein